MSTIRGAFSGVNPLFWRELRQYRKQARLTQQALAEQAGCTRQEISKMENGTFRGGVYKLQRICEQLGLSLMVQEQMSRSASETEVPIRILAIDDDPSVLSGYRQLFEPTRSNGMNALLDLVEHGTNRGSEPRFSIKTTTSGEEGFSLVEQALQQGEAFQILLLDLRIPDGWDGLYTAQQIRKLSAEIKIILISAYRDYTLSKIREAVGENFILHSKPYHQEELIQLVSYMAGNESNH